MLVRSPTPHHDHETIPLPSEVCTTNSHRELHSHYRIFNPRLAHATKKRSGNGSERQRQRTATAAAVRCRCRCRGRCRCRCRALPLVAAVAAASRHCRCRRRWLGCLFFHGVSPVWPLGSKTNSMRMQWAETAPVGRSSPSLQISARGRSNPYHQLAWVRYRRLSAPT